MGAERKQGGVTRREFLRRVAAGAAFGLGATSGAVSGVARGAEEAVAEPLEEAVDAYWEVADAFGEVCDLFPFSLEDPQVPGPEVRAKAIVDLRTARAAETRAAAAMARAVEMWPTE